MLKHKTLEHLNTERRDINMERRNVTEIKDDTILFLEIMALVLL